MMLLILIEFNDNIKELMRVMIPEVINAGATGGTDIIGSIDGLNDDKAMIKVAFKVSRSKLIRIIILKDNDDDIISKMRLSSNLLRIIFDR